MIELVLGHIDLARVRFAHSPVRELVASLLVLQDPRRQPMYGRWLSSVRPRLGGVRLELLVALVPAGRLLPTFLLPAPSGPWPTLAEELAAVAAIPPDVVRAELELVSQGRPLPAALRAVYEDPAGQLPLVARELDRYWQVAVAPVWQRMRAVCTADVAHRMERFAEGGLARVLGGLHPQLALEADRRGLAELWDDTPAEGTDPLSALVGRTRARLLATLGLPRTTTQLAAELGLSPPAVSQHLKVLKDTALVTARRRGRMVLYQRTPTATTLLEVIRSHEQTG